MHSGTHTGGGGGGAAARGGGGVKQVTHESPPHNSQFTTLKFRGPPTLPWKEFER